MLRDETSGDSRRAIKFSKTHGSSNFTTRVTFRRCFHSGGIMFCDSSFFFFFNFWLSVNCYVKKKKKYNKEEKGIMYGESCELKYSKVLFQTLFRIKRIRGNVMGFYMLRVSILPFIQNLRKFDNRGIVIFFLNELPFTKLSKWYVFLDYLCFFVFLFVSFNLLSILISSKIKKFQSIEIINNNVNNDKR